MACSRCGQLLRTVNTQVNNSLSFCYEFLDRACRSTMGRTPNCHENRRCCSSLHQGYTRENFSCFACFVLHHAVYFALQTLLQLASRMQRSRCFSAMSMKPGLVGAVGVRYVYQPKSRNQNRNNEVPGYRIGVTKGWDSQHTGTLKTCYMYL